MSENISTYPVYTYVSTQAGYDPAKTYYLCASEQDAATLDSAARFAENSGWLKTAEEQGAILVMPLAPQGWDDLPPTLLMDIYGQTRNKFQTRSGKAPWGRQGNLWCWETVLYLVGYGEGADFAGNALVTCPNMFAAVALVGGAPTDFSAGNQSTSHWFVKNVSANYDKKNQDIPVCLWMLGGGERAERTAAYFAQSCGIEPDQFVQMSMRGYSTRLWQTPRKPAQQVRIFSEQFEADSALTELIVSELFNHVVRWKDGPDGTLDWIDSQEEFYHDSRFIRHTIASTGDDYDFFVHLPDGMDREEAAGLPLVFTVHGRGEPAWMFTTKNGWDKLADETREFIVVSPDSPGNIWFLDRDGDAFPKMVEAMRELYQIDPSRVYLTGFSNGGMMVREVGIRFPELFAGVSPWNAPRMDSFTLHKEDSPAMPDHFSTEMNELLAAFAQSGYELPYYFCYGDNDPAASPEDNLLLDAVLKANGCTNGPVPVDNALVYPPTDGFVQGERISTAVYPDADGTARVAVTTMRDMPHGAIHDESRAVWNFLKQFRRVPGARKISVGCPQL